MTLYALAPADIADLLALIGSQGLTITANNAVRVAQLQALLANAKPSDEVAQLKQELETMRAQLHNAMDALTIERDARRVESQARQVFAPCKCGHAQSEHTPDCMNGLCTCMAYESSTQ